MTTGESPSPDISLGQIDLSDMEFWAGPRDEREAAFKALRDAPGLVHFDERIIEIQRRLPSLRITGEPEYLQSNFINGIKRLQCSWD